MLIVYVAAGVFGAALAYQLIVGRKAVVQAASDALDAVNPLNQDNAIKTTVDKVVEKWTGTPDQTLGGWIYDVTHPNAGLAPGETITNGVISNDTIAPIAPVAPAEAGAAPDIGMQRLYDTMTGI